ncbi:MAG TPA: D-2-hydroxyacid dehydrogenase [Campylobacterales bacterium]|nr:D-2-hydroxyacid dehydrogenase [Campylobacterales bacterium]
MSARSIVFLDYATLGGSSLAKIERLGLLSVYETTKSDEITLRAKDAEIIITNKVVLDESVINSLPKLKLICIAATGVNNIDLKACEKAGIAVCNVKGYSTTSVAQIVFSSLFYAISKISRFDAFVKNGEYAKSPIFTYMGEQFSELAGKNFGIIGFGEIGQRVANIALSFGANVLYYSTSGKNSVDGFRRVGLDEILQTSDILSVHAALNEHTKNLISEKEIQKLSKNAILINFARGGIVDEKAVAKALNADSLGAYISDVFEREPIANDSALLSIVNKEKLVLTPHIGWASIEARDRLIGEIANNIKAFLEG